MVKSDLKYLFLTALMVLAGACSPDGTVELFLLRSTVDSQHPLPADQITHVRVTVDGPGMSTRQRTYPFVPGGSSRLTEVPIGNDRVITVEGLGGEDDTFPISRGRTGAIRISRGHNEIDVFIARVRSFSLGPDEGLRYGRFRHSLAVGPDGRVFMSGGAAGGTFDAPTDALSSIEAFDPTSAQTALLTCETGIGCLNAPRIGGAVALVDDGFMLFGGMNEEGLLNTVELVDTELEMVELRRAAGAERVHAASVVVNNLTVLAGGLNASGEVVDTLEIVNRQGDIRTRALPAPRWGMASAAAHATAFFFGGYDDAGDITSEFMIYDPFEDKGELHESDLEPRAFAAASTLSDGRVMVIGGMRADGTASSSVDLYDPGRGLLCHIGEFDEAIGGRWHMAAVTLADGRVLVTGGLVGTGQATITSRILDPRYIELGDDCDAPIFGTLGDELAAPTQYQRYLSSAVLLENQSVLVVGGLDEAGTPIAQPEIYIPE